jgi:hypothetical protein
MVPLVLGVLLAVIAVAMAKDVKLPLRGFAVGMIVLPLVYMGFALLVGDMAAMGWEFLYGLPYFIVGVLLYRRGFAGSGLLVVALWALHAAYDVYHHALVDNAGVPGWYPALCLGFDLVMVVYLAVAVAKLPKFDMFDTAKAEN